MNEARNYIAVDLGAESGRLMLGALAGGKLELKEVHRFGNGPLEQEGALRWDFPRLLMEIKRGIRDCLGRTRGDIAGIAVDSWGVDFGLLDADGRLIENPYHYRDDRTEGILEEAFRLMPREEIYQHTGIQFMRINSLYQLLAQSRRDKEALKRTRKILFIADLAAYHLCGKMFGEYTLASTSQMMDMSKGEWSEAVLCAFGLPADILPTIVQPGTVVGKLSDDLAAEFGCDPIPVTAVGSHDTAGAVAAVPAEGENWAYISSGTWSLIGVELPRPAINPKSYENEFTNEGGVEGTIRFLKNVTGLWPLQECRREWREQGDDLSYAELTAMAETARPFAAHINPDYADFLSPGDMPDKINRYLAATDQGPLEDRGEIVRTILEGLAFAYRRVIEKTEEASGRKIDVIHIVGGGSRNELLNRFTADATGREVVAGPIEAAAIGNVLMQAKAAGQAASLEEIRSIVRNSFPTERYAPTDAETWDDKYEERRTHGG